MAGAQTRGTRGGRADTTGGATTRDLADQRRARRDRDAPHEAAWKAGYSGGDRGDFETDDRLADQYDAGAAFRSDEDRRQARGARVQQLRSGPVASAGGAANQGAGILLGLFAYALLVNYLQGGVKGTKAWLSAKFLNRPTGGAAKPRTPIKAATPTANTAVPARPAAGGA